MNTVYEKCQFLAFAVDGTVVSFHLGSAKPHGGVALKERPIYTVFRFPVRDSSPANSYAHLVCGRGIEKDAMIYKFESNWRLLAQHNVDSYDRTRLFHGTPGEMVELMSKLNAGTAASLSGQSCRLRSWNVVRTNYHFTGRRSGMAKWRAPSPTRRVIMMHNHQLVFCVHKNHLDCVWFQTDPLPTPGRETPRVQDFHAWPRRQDSRAVYRRVQHTEEDPSGRRRAHSDGVR